MLFPLHNTPERHPDNCGCLFTGSGSRFKIRGKPDLQTPFLAPNKGKSKRKAGDELAYIVFQRKGAARTDMYSVRTVSVPQMLGNSHVRDRKKQEDDTFKGGCRYHREGHKNRAEPGKRGDPDRREAERDHQIGRAHV